MLDSVKRFFVEGFWELRVLNTRRKKFPGLKVLTFTHGKKLVYITAEEFYDDAVGGYSYIPVGEGKDGLPDFERYKVDEVIKLKSHLVNFKLTPVPFFGDFKESCR